MGIEKVASITQNLHYQFVVFKPLSVKPLKQYSKKQQDLKIEKQASFARHTDFPLIKPGLITKEFQ